MIALVEDVKLKKIEKLRELGVNPYPYSYNKTNDAAQIKQDYEKYAGKIVSVAGRLMRLREMGKLRFLNILDATAGIQVLFKEDIATKISVDIMNLADIGDILGIRGTVIKSNRGEISIEALEVEMLSKTLRTLPEKFHGLTDIELRYRKRYLDLMMNQDVRKTFWTRTNFVDHIRSFLNQRGYMEVETPILQPTYGGANAKPFTTHHNDLDSDMYLRIANELYLKRLVIGGIEKVYEFSKDFRNESIDSTHNPEFTQIEIYEAYRDYQDFAKMTEEILSSFAKKISGKFEIEYQGKMVNFAPEFDRVYMVDAIKKACGVDISTMTDDDAVDIAKKERLEVAVKNAYHVSDALFDKYIKPNLQNPTFVMDFPAYMCPLTKDKRGNNKLSERFELYVAGYEVSNCYSELTDPIEQRKKFEEQLEERKKGDDEMPPIDYDFLEAIEYGMPPMAGIGISIDRLVMIFTNNVSIKETILFPAARPEKVAEK